jgi:hypothetical protein
MVAMAMRNGDLDQAKQMMEMKREFEADEARKSYAQAMSKFRGICPPIAKDSHVKYGQTDYMHETLDGILTTISDALSACGLGVTFPPNVEDGNIVVTCRITHKDGHFEEGSLPSPPDASGGKNAIQAIGSAITYLQRYTLKSMLGLSAGVDNDANLPPPINYLTEDQQKEIWAYAQENKIEPDLDRLLKSQGLTKIEQVLAESYTSLMTALKKKAEAKANG